MITWIIENYSKENSYAELIESVRKENYPLIEIKGDYKKNDLDNISGCVLFNGSIGMSKLIKKQLQDRCKPIIYSNFENYLCSKYYPYFGRLLFNDKYIIIPLIDLQRNRFLIYGMMGKEGVIFIRPDSGEKPFQAQLLDIIDLDRFIENNTHIKNELVIVSSPKNIKWEGRFVVNRNKQMIAYSTYIFQGQTALIPSVPEKAMEKCREILSIHYYPDSVFCIDICEDSDGNFWLLELTSFSSAGLYACNKDSIVKYASQMALEDFNLKI